MLRVNCMIQYFVTLDCILIMVSGSVYSDISGSIPPHPRRLVSVQYQFGI